MVGEQKVVYLLYDPARDLHKIGVSKDPVYRLKQLQTGNGEQLLLVHAYPTTRADKIERSLHQFYEQGRKIGEWFDLPAGEVDTFLGRCQFFEGFHTRREKQYFLIDLE